MAPQIPAAERGDHLDPLAAAMAAADALVAEGRPTAAARQLMRYRPAPQATQRHIDAVWHYLGKVPPFDVLDLASGGGGAERGWWRLKRDMLTSLTLSEQRRRFTAWRSAHPQHPAARTPPVALLPLQGPAPAVQRVALMLPLSGPLSRAGRAVRDAFVAVYLSRAHDVDFDVRIYDTAAEPLATLYERALVDGAGVLIGPLSKENVARLNALEPEVPVLALNYLGNEVPAANLLQLGLAIEDEAVTLADWLRDERADRVLAFHNTEEWSNRALRTLGEQRPARMTTQMLDDIRTVTESVGAAMHVAASQERREALQALIGETVEFVPRARRDVDAIVALVAPVEAAALVPALRFHFAQRVPVYATSQTVRGAGERRLRELEGFRITELPWFTREEASFRELNAVFDLTDSPFAALYALGVDAFRLADRAPLIIDGHFTELLGSTGELEFPPSGRIERRLARAVVARGGVVAASAAGR